MLKQQKYSILFLSLFLGMLLVSTVEKISNASNGFEIILETDIEWDKESEDSKKDTEDTDKIITDFSYNLVAEIKVSHSCLYRHGNGLANSEIILPPPELKS